jgi:His-Xaa-Ser system protein HxsD
LVITREVVLDLSGYSIDAIQRAAYKLSEQLSVDIRSESSGYRCLLHLEGEPTEDDAEALAADFRREVLDQALRERIRGETEQVRNLILAFAFSNTGLAVEE